MVSGLNQQQNQNLQYGMNNRYGGVQNSASNMVNPAVQNPQSGQNFGQLTSRPDTFENNQNDPNFGAIDKETIEKGAQEVQKQVDDNPFTAMVKNMFGIDIHNPKKTLISLGLTLTTVLGLAKLGNSKFATEKLADIGIDVSKALKNNSAYMNVTSKLKGAKESVVKFLRKNKSIDDIFETFANRKAGAVNPLAKGTGTGLKRIFSLTPPDTATTVLDKMVKADDAAELSKLKKLVANGDSAADKLNKLKLKGKNIAAEQLEVLTNAINDGVAAKAPLDALQAKIDVPKLDSLKKLVGESKAREMLDAIGGDSMDVSNKLLNLIGENFGVMKDGVVTDEKGLQTILRQLKAGKITGLDGSLNIDVSEFTNVKMNNNKGFQKIVSDWWPVNLVDNIGKKIRGDKWKPFGRGNLGDSLIKHSIISGKATSTKAGSFVQQLALFPSEAISNFGNDKSGLGFFLCGMIMNLYNNVQDAPKEKKAATMADDFMGTIGSLAITTPLACATMYGLATMKNVKGTGIVSKYLLKPMGKLFGAGLDKYAKDGKLISSAATKSWKNIIPRWGGGALRFALIMFVFQSIFNKPVRGAVNKIFGKPYDPAEEEQMKQMQAQAQNMEAAMKELNLTEEQMVAKLQANPEFVTALQNDPQALQAIQNDPTLLLKLIAQLPDNGSSNGAQNSAGMNNAAVQGNRFASAASTPSSLLNKHVNNGQNPSMQAQRPEQNPQGSLNNNTQNTPAQAQNMQAGQQAAQASGQNAISDNQNKSNEPVRKYIPSSKPFNYVEGDQNTIKAEEITNQNVQAMLSKADRAEREAMKILG